MENATLTLDKLAGADFTISVPSGFYTKNYRLIKKSMIKSLLLEDLHNDPLGYIDYEWVESKIGEISDVTEDDLSEEFLIENNLISLFAEEFNDNIGYEKHFGDAECEFSFEMITINNEDYYCFTISEELL